jgi:hypothetical protein
MQQACTTGDLSTLQHLIQNNLANPPNIHALLATAVASQKPDIVVSLLSTRPTLSLSQSTNIAASLLSSANVSILKILLAHDPMFTSISIDYGYRCFLTDACFCPPSKIEPLIHVLLDAGGDVNDGQGPNGGALLAALEGGQGKDIIVKIVRKGGIVGALVIDSAIRKERVDVLPFLLRKGRGRVGGQELWERAKEIGNEEVKELVRGFMLDGMNEKKTEGKAWQKGSWWEVWKLWK